MKIKIEKIDGSNAFVCNFGVVLIFTMNRGKRLRGPKKSAKTNRNGAGEKNTLALKKNKRKKSGHSSLQ